MKNYDFLNLSPYEFEILSRDLLQKHLNIYLESFGDGADQGIDLRYSENEGFIVQCKRYKDFNSLISNLKKEVVKVRSLNCKKYVICTSSSLLPEQKKGIVDLFYPYILNSSDIYGKQDLNNLLTLYPEIEKSFYKLWLSSTEILQEIVNSQIVNQSRFVKDEINEKIKVYVQNKSFPEALSILEDSNYVIISGIPGIGKTTLAEMLVFHLLGNGIEEFIYLSDSITNGFKLFNEAKKQIFLFDDFLGKNFLQNNIATNEEKQIIRFIKRVQKTHNKYLIFTTREYILNQAKQKFEDLENANFSKCILDLSKYSTLVKAEILYNHFFINEIPFEYISAILNQGALFKIINHKNYNPRIIETFTNSKIWKDTKVENFPTEVLELFDNPYLVWQHVYENQISELGRIILDCLLIVDEEIEYHLLYQQVKKYTNVNHENVNSTLNNHTFKSAIKILENSLINIKKNLDDSFLISYQNPSIQDFIVNYISKDRLSRKYLIDSILFISPMLNIITTSTNERLDHHKLLITNEEMTRIEQNIINDFDNLYYDSKYSAWSKPSKDDIEFLKLNKMKEVFPIDSFISHEFIKQKFLRKLYSDTITNNSIAAYTSLFEKLHDEIDFDISLILTNISGAFWAYDDLIYLYAFKELDPEAFDQFQEENEDIYYDIFTYIVDDITSEDSDDIGSYEENINRLKELSSDFNYWVDDDIKKIKEKIKAIEDEEKERMALEQEDEYDYFGRHKYYLDYHDEDIRREQREMPVSTSKTRIIRKGKNESEIIMDLFKSLE